MAARVGDAEIEIGGFGEVAVGAQVADGGDIVAVVGAWKTSSLSPRKTCAVPSRKMPLGAGRMRLSERPASSMPSSPPTRFWVTSGRSVQGSTWLCSVLTFPKAARILPTFNCEPGGQSGKGEVALFQVTPCSPKLKKKSARA